MTITFLRDSLLWCAVVNYSGMALYKIAVLSLNVAPYIALRIATSGM